MYIWCHFLSQFLSSDYDRFVSVIYVIIFVTLLTKRFFSLVFNNILVSWIIYLLIYFYSYFRFVSPILHIGPNLVSKHVSVKEVIITPQLVKCSKAAQSVLQPVLGKDVHIVVPFLYLSLSYCKFEWAENVAVQARTKKLKSKQICSSTKWFLWKLDNLSHL